MAHVTLEKVIGKLSDYAICTKCDSLNLLENEKCVHEECDTPLTQEKDVFDWVLKEEEFWKNEGYDENEIYNLEYYV